MKKIIVSAFCLTLCVSSATALVPTNFSNSSVSVILNDERKVIKVEELPEPVTKALAGDDYKGWIVKEAAMVTNGDNKHYEVILSNDKESKTLKFNNDGTLVK